MYKVPQRQVHLDFHTTDAIEGVGSKFDRQNFIDCLKVGHVNSITLFAKCHHGWSYYPSKVNPINPSLKFDLLSEQISACKEAGVACPIYISVGFDDKYFFAHPDHSVKHTVDHVYPKTLYKDGRPYSGEDYFGFHRLCLNSPYLDYVLLQVKEVVEWFMPEGIFLDIVGEINCYCDHCRKTAKDLGVDIETAEGMAVVKKHVYKNYYQRVREVATSIKPDIKIFHNGGHIDCGRRDLAYANTHLELESLPTGGWGYDHFPLSAKYVKNLGMEYLGMTGKFHKSWGEFGGFKHPNALKYEVALNLAFGAKCSIGDQMHPLGFMDKATYELIGQAYAEAELVEDYCYNADTVADIGVLSAESFGAGRGNFSDTGSNRILLEGKYLFEILDTDCDFNKYKLIIVAEDVRLDDNAITKLYAFVNNGGKILSTGKSGELLLEEFDLGAKYIGASKYDPSYLNPAYNATGLTPSNYVIYSKMYNVELTDSNAKVLAYGKEPYFTRCKWAYCSHRHTPFKLEDGMPTSIVGKNGGYIAFDIFNEYAIYGCYSAKELVIKTIDEILGDSKTLTTNLQSLGIVSLNDQTDKSRLVLHALYASPIKRGSDNNALEVIEDLVPVYDTTFIIKTDKKVKSVMLVPENKKVKFTYKNGTLKFNIDKFTCKQVVSIDYQK